MRSLACVRRLLPAALAAAALSLGAVAARADEAEQLRGDIVAGLEEMFAGAQQDKTFSYEGVDVQGSAPPYDVAIRGIRLGAPEAGQTELGTVSFRLAPVREGVYEVSDLKLPSPVEFHDASGGVSGTLSIGGQSFKGVWSKTLRTFLSMDGSFTDIQGADATGKTVLRIATVAVNGDSTETSPDHWDQTATFKVAGLSADGDTGTVSVDSVEARSEVHGLDVPAVEKLREYVQTLTAAVAEESAPFMDEEGGPQEPAGAEPQAFDDGGPTGNTGGEGSDMSQDLPDEGLGDAPASPAEEAAAARMLEILRNLSTLFADASTRFAVHGLSVRGTDGAELLTLDEGGIEFGLSGLDTPRSGFRLAYRHLGLKADWASLDESGTGAPDPEAQQLIDALAPHDLVLDLRIEDLPGKELWQLFLDTVAAQENLQDAEDASALFGMGAVGTLQQAGSKLRLVDSRLVSNSASLSLDGALQADANAPMGATGALTVEINGLDDVIALVKAHATGPDAAEETAPLELLRAFGERRTEDGGRVVDRYVLSLDPSGALLLNGKDFQFLFNAMGEAGGEPGQDMGPMPQEEPGPNEPEGEPQP